MHVGFVREIHQVVDHQPVVALDVVQAAAVCPRLALGPFQVMDPGGIGLLRIARPDPDEAVALHHRKLPDARKAAHPLARHAGALAVGLHGQAVVAAHEVAVTHKAERQRRAAVRAEVFQRGHLALLAAVEHHALAADAAAQRLVGDLIGVQATYQAFLRNMRLSPWGSQFRRIPLFISV